MIPLDEQIKAVKREIGMREHVYPHWVRQGRMKQDEATYQLDAMKAVLDTLISITVRIV